MVGSGRSARLDAGDVSTHRQTRLLRTLPPDARFRRETSTGPRRRLVRVAAGGRLTVDRRAKFAVARRVPQRPSDAELRQTTRRVGESSMTRFATMNIDRRQFLQLGAACATGAAALAREAPREPTAAKLPRWRGFNLLEKCYGQHNRPYAENDFALLAEWGFDFVRLPMSYRCWSNPDDLRAMRESVLKEIDAAVEYGHKHRVHVCLNFHRAPGYCVNPPAEPIDLWK